MSRGRADACDVAVVGGGPNGLTAAAWLARAGLEVRVFEAGATPGGGCRSAELTLPGFLHDRCAAVHPMGALSPVFRALSLESDGLEWIHPETPLAHPLPDGSAAVLLRSPAATAQALGRDGAAWQRWIEPFSRREFVESLLDPLWPPTTKALLTKARFGLVGLRSAEGMARGVLHTEAARALFAGCAAHSVLALDRAGTAAFGIVLAASAHAVGWPVARGGSQSIVDALQRVIERHGGTIATRRSIDSLQELPAARAVVFDVAPRQLARIAGEALPSAYRERLERYRHGPGVFKVDWALREPIPWRNAECRDAATVHVGGAFAEVLRSEAEMMAGGYRKKYQRAVSRLIALTN